MRVKSFDAATASILAIALAGLGVREVVPVVAQAGQGVSARASGGFVELATSTGVRPVLKAADIAAFLPTTRGSFIFPAPYGTQGYRLTLPDDCAGQDCVNYIGYSYWRNINNHAGSNILYALVGLDQNRGGGGPTLFSVDKTTSEVAKIGPLFSTGDPRGWLSGEGWYFSATSPTMLYIRQGTAFTRYDVLGKTTSTVFDLKTATDVFGTSRVLWQLHSSNDDRVHSFTVEDGISYQMLGCGVYLEASRQFKFFPTLRGKYDECQVDKSGRWLMIKEDVDGRKGNDNRIIDLEAGSETILLDENGGMGHSDAGFGDVVGADDWFDYPVLRLWKFGTLPVGPGTVVYRDPSWVTQSMDHVSRSNALPGSPASQYACGSSVSRTNGPRNNEIGCFMLDGSLRTLVVAPVMTDLDATGGGDDYAKSPKGNLDVTGQYFIWTSNTGGGRLDAFVVRIPSEVLLRGPAAPTGVRVSPAP
jgi:hypothetical protein